MENKTDVRTVVATGGLWHAQSGSGTFAPPSMRNLGYDALLVVDARNARMILPAVVATQATAKQAPQSRRSSAHP